jgi:hypothetical protein
MKNRILFSILLTLSVLFSLMSRESETYGQERRSENPHEEASPERPPVKKEFTPAKSLNEALYLASRPGKNSLPYVEQAKSFLEHGANPKVADERGRTPIHWTVIGGI